MPKVECAICHGTVTTTGKNYIFANNLHQHKKCPKKDVLPDEEKIQYRALTDEIKNSFVNKALDDKYGLNWGLITKQIEDLKKQGYSYTDQLYALKYVVNKDKGYWGYGRIAKFIESAMEQKKREEAYKEKQNIPQDVKEEIQDTPKLKVVSKPTFMRNFEGGFD